MSPFFVFRTKFTCSEVLQILLNNIKAYWTPVSFILMPFSWACMLNYTVAYLEFGLREAVSYTHLDVYKRQVFTYF